MANAEAIGTPAGYVPLWGEDHENYLASIARQFAQKADWRSVQLAEILAKFDQALDALTDNPARRTLTAELEEHFWEYNYVLTH